MNEAVLKSALNRTFKAELPPRWVVLRHEGGAVHAGISDFSVTGEGYTTWLEVKFANPALRSRGIQDLTMKRLANAGRALYVVYRLYSDGTRETRILTPACLDEWMTSGVSHPGFNHTFVVRHLVEAHSYHDDNRS